VPKNPNKPGDFENKNSGFSATNKPKQLSSKALNSNSTVFYPSIYPRKLDNFLIFKKTIQMKKIQMRTLKKIAKMSNTKTVTRNIKQ